MNDRQAPEWLDTLERCGLEVTGKAAPDGPPANAAIYAVSGFEVEPVAAILSSTPTPLTDWTRRGIAMLHKLRSTGRTESSSSSHPYPAGARSAGCA
jgi:hypothetical protein